MDTHQIVQLVTALKRFEYELAGPDRIWNILYQNQQAKWNHLKVRKYQSNFYLWCMEQKLPGLEIAGRKDVKVMPQVNRSSYVDKETTVQQWVHIAESALAWLRMVERDWIRTNNKVRAEYPLTQRYGFIPHSLLRTSLKDIWRIDQQLGKRRCRKFIQLVENPLSSVGLDGRVHSMTAAHYFEYCRIAYVSIMGRIKSFDRSMTGREMYETYADGRHEGLLDIDENSGKEFADWIDETHPKRTQGGHPWEIMRGGNSTHIDLYVRRPWLCNKKEFVVELIGESPSRLAETVTMFLALTDAGKPIAISDPENIRARILAQDNIGIVPEYEYLQGANHHFPENQKVFDVTYYSSFGRYKRRLRPFITWDPLPLMKPVNP